MKRIRIRFWVVALYALGMAWVESAVVLYLRTLVHRVEPYQSDPLPMLTGFAFVEMVREAATIMMLGAVGWLAGSNFRSRIGYFLAAFGVWDIFYYVFLRIMCGWPHSFLDWDILFLLPLPWWGPVIAPCLIAALMVLFGWCLTAGPNEISCGQIRSSSWCLLGLGVIAALLLFMKDSIGVLGDVNPALAVRRVLPVDFPWAPFLTSLGLMAAPLVESKWSSWPRFINHDKSTMMSGAKNEF